MRRPGAFAAAGVMAAVLSGAVCGRPSDEAAIRALLKETAARAEKRDLDGLMALFAPDYVDAEGRDAAATRSLVAAYLGRYRGLVVHLLGARIGAPGADGRAALECEVALSHGAARALRRLVRVAGECYRFRIEVQRADRGAWRFLSAEWRPVSPAELFPESLGILKELFPGL